jgi:hypothetical protein
VGETAESVSKRRLEPLPNKRVCWVLRDSLGRGGGCDGRAGRRWGNMASEVVMEGGARCSRGEGTEGGRASMTTVCVVVTTSSHAWGMGSDKEDGLVRRPVRITAADGDG